jgi:hypothetical protein
VGIIPLPPDSELPCWGTLVVETGALSITYKDRLPPEPD